MVVVGFAGRAQHGKDTAAQALVKTHGFLPVAFADPVRTGLLALDPYVECGHLHYGAMAEQGIPVPCHYERLSDLVRRFGWDRVKQLPEVRRLKQRFGTEAGRDLHGIHCWVKLMHEALQGIDGCDVVVTDVRFPNEADLVHEHGGRVYLIDRPGYDNGLPYHSSEPEDFSWADVCITNDDTPEHLQKQVLEQFERDFQLCWTPRSFL